MNTTQIQKKAKVVNNAQGRPVEVIVPYEVYQEMLHTAMSIEIYQQDDTQESLANAKDDIRRGNTASFKNADKAVAWLK